VSTAIRVLCRTDVEALLDLDTCIAAVEEAFRQHGTGQARAPAVLGMEGFHVKAGLLQIGRLYFAAKVNGNFAGNAALGLPRIQGLVVLSDGATGVPLAVIDSVEITRLRTAAATAVAGRHLARADAAVATLCGCGAQGAAQVRALMRVRPLRKLFAVDLDPARARALADALSAELEVTVTDDLPAAVRASAICVTCTPSRRPIVFRDFVAPGTFIAAVGADSADKQELDPALMAAATVVTDVLEQCATIGDLHHALAAGLVQRDDVHADLGEIVAGRRPGRRSPGEIIVFDSTGMALQDVAAAAAAYERAEATGRGVTAPI
jgi:alanine dehydrogenase